MGKNNKKIRINAIIVALSVLMALWAGCRQEPETPRPVVTSLAFIESRIEMKIGEKVTARINMQPVEVRKYEEIQYSASVEGYIELSEKSNDGVVVTALAGGTVIVVAKAGEYTAYLEVNIEHEEIIVKPYIVVPTQVIEVYEGMRKSVQVSLYNGNAVDNALFVWEEEEGKDNIRVQSTGNEAVVEGLKRGSQKIIISNEISEYKAEILVFVIGVNETVKYITTGENIMFLTVGGINKHITANLMNGSEIDKNDFTFAVIEGEENIRILSSNNTCSVSPVKEGTSVIKVSHPLSEYDLEVRVIVYAGEESYIEIDKNFILMSIGEQEKITARIEGLDNERWNYDFSYSSTDESVAQVQQLNNEFIVTAAKGGTSIVQILNSNIEYSREVLVMVREQIHVLPDEIYITTSQNVVQLEIGQETATNLYMQLVGGIEADRNGFSWTVEDGTIVEAESSYGKVNYQKRSVIDVLNAVALLTPKKIGVTKIKIEHPKSEVASEVLVKVYPRGTLAGTPFILGNAEGGLIKIDSMLPPKRVTLHMESGSENNVGGLNWEIAQTGIATALDVKGLVNDITGRSQGITKLKVDNKNLQNPYEAVIMVDTNDTVLYADNVYQTVAVGQSVSVQIKDSNNYLSNRTNFRISGFNSSILSATMITSRLLLQGLKEGETVVRVENPDASVFPLTINVKVVPAELTILKPYSINGPNFFGMAFGQTRNIDVSMPNASDAERDQIAWSMEGQGIITLSGNGESTMAQAQYTVGQVNVKAIHPKSINEKTIVVYVVATPEELASAIVLGIEKQNYLLRPGEEEILQLITNAEGSDKAAIHWQVQDPNTLKLDYNGDKALIRGLRDGSTVITVTHPENVIPLKIYVSVSSAAPLEKRITLPAIIEMDIGENLILKADTEGLTEAEKKAIRWEIEDETVITLTGDGDKAFLLGKKLGSTWITVRQSQIGYEKKILAACGEMYVMNSPESYYRMEVGDQKNIELVFGKLGFPEREKGDIVWTVSGNNNVVEVYPRGDKATIEAKNVGLGKIIVSHRNNIVAKSVEITFEVYKDEMLGYFIYESIVGLVNGEENSKEIAVQMSPATLGYSQITWQDEKENEWKNDISKKIVNIQEMGEGNEFRLTGLKKGQTYLRLEHPLARDPARILIYTADTQEELDEMFPIALRKSNYLLTMGGRSEDIIIDTINDDPEKLAKITWGVDNANIVTYSVSADKKTVTISPRNAGSCVFNLRYDGQTVEYVYVSVRNSVSIDFTKRIATESIIGLELGVTNRRTTAGHNLSVADVNMLEWESMNESVVKVKEINGDKASAYLEAVGIGETEVILSLGLIKRYIKVYVKETEAEVKEYKAVNIDNRYYQIRRNDEMTLTAYHAMANADSNDRWEIIPVDNNVVEVISAGKNKGQIKGINEGVAQIQIYNSECDTDVVVMVEVSNTAPVIEPVVDDWYLSALKTFYVLDQNAKNVVTRIEINAVRFTEEERANIKWNLIPELSDGTDIVQMFGNGGPFIDVSPKGKKGKVVIRVEHPRSVNHAEITILCDAEAMIEADIPYITATADTVKIKLHEEAEVALKIENLEGYDIGQFTATSDNQKAEIKVTGNVLTITGEAFGQCLITVRHPSVTMMAKKIVVIIASETENIVYMTTSQNFVLVEKGDYKTVNVSLVGHTEYDDKSFFWYAKTPQDSALVQINASGTSAVITGVGIGTAEIKVRYQYSPDYELSIFVRVTEKIGALPVYISTSNNVITVKEGDSVRANVNLVNGPPSDYSQFRWDKITPQIIETVDSGNTALIKGLRPGTGSVTVSHPLSNNSISIMVIVEPQEMQSSIYLTTPTQLIEMGTSGQQSAQVTIVGGEQNDIYGLLWEVTSYVSFPKRTDGTSYRVIDLVYNADNCFIYPVTNQASGAVEGEAIITVSHPKTNYKLNIKVVVMESTEVVFAERFITMTAGEQKTVDMKAPSNTYLSYTSSNPAGLKAEGTSTICLIQGLREGTYIVSAYTVTGNKSDEILVRVNAASNPSSTYYIDTGISVLPMVGLGKTQPMNAVVKNAATGAEVSVTDSQITWTSLSPNIVKVRSVAGGNGTTTNGKSVLFESSQAGEAQIRVSALTASKIVNVKVTLEDTSFTLSDYAIVMTTGEKKFVWAELSEVDGYTANNLNMVFQYEDNPQTPKDIVKLATAASGSTNPSNDSANKRRTWEIEALKKGEVVLRIEYKSGANVLAVRNISLIINNVTTFTAAPTSVMVYPGGTADFIVDSSYDATGNGEAFNVSADNNASYTWLWWSNANAQTFSGTANNAMPAGVKVTVGGIDLYRRKIRITGTNYLGEGNIEIQGAQSKYKANVSVFNLDNYTVKWKDRQVIRGTPNPAHTKTITYETYPPTDYLKPRGMNWTESKSAWENDFVSITHNAGTKTFTLTPKKAGYMELIFRTATQFNGPGENWSGTNKELKLPVFFYYDEVTVNFSLGTPINVNPTDNNNPKFSNTGNFQMSGTPRSYVKSRIDNSNTAVFITRGEELRIDFKAAETFINSGVGVTSVSNQINLNSENISVTSTARDITIYGGDNVKHEEIGEDQLIGATFAGTITVVYEYYNGGEYAQYFYKTYMVYFEDWVRVMKRN